MPLQNLFGGLALDTTLQQLRDLAFFKDSTDIEQTPVCLPVTALGDTVLYTPAAGKRVRLHWSYVLNDPSANTPARITIKLGTQVKFIVYGVAKRQVLTGPVDGQLIVNLSVAGNVACTFFLEEV